MHRSNVYRAVVQEADATTGRIAVTIPGVAGPSSRFQVTGLGREEVEGTWKVPPIGSVVLVAAEDENLATLFLVQTYTYDAIVRTTDLYGDLHGPVVIEARNDTNTTISSGKVVYATADGGDLVIGMANANDAAKMPALGIAMESIAPDDVGKVAVSGLLEGVNTSGLSAGIDIYAAANGGLSVTNVGLTVKQVVGKVVDVGASGSFLVAIQPPLNQATSGDFTGSFTGTIYATAGVIGGSTSGWVIDSGRIESYGAGDKIILDGTDGEIYIGTYGSGVFNSASTSFYVNKDGEFSLGDKLTWDGSTLEIDGTITATDGFIGGWEIGPTSLHSGASSNYVALSTGGSTSIWAGASTAGSAPFRVSNTGDLYAESATIEGSITATSGSIGDWVVNGSTLQSSGASPIVLDSGNGKIYVGNPNWGNTANSFYVDRTGKFGLSDNLTWNPTGGASGTGVLVLDGQIDANQATFANWSLEPYRLYAGTAGDYIELNSNPAQEYRTWAGHPTASVAPFSVRRNGFVTASSSTVNLYETNRILGRMVVANTSGSMYLGASVTPSSDNGLWINDYNYWYDTGTFRLGGVSNYLSWVGSTLSVVSSDTTITGGSININGAFNVSNVGAVRIGPASGNALYIANTGAITIGTSEGSGNFKVSTNGSVNIGGSAGMYVSNDGALWSGNSSSVSSSFLVDSSGNVRIGSAASSSLHVKSLAGSTAGSIGMLYVGSDTDNTTNFRITKSGQVDIGDIDGNGSFHISPSGDVWTGASLGASVNAPFLLRNTGAIRIGGDDNTSLNIDANGNVYAGAATFNSSKIRIEASSGSLYAENASVNSVNVRGVLYGWNTAGTFIDGLSIVGNASVGPYGVYGAHYTGQANNVYPSTPASVVPAANYALTPLGGFAASINGSALLSIGLNGARMPSGSSAAPSFSFTSDPDTGMYTDGFSLLFSCAGTLGMALTADQRIRGTNGLVSAPTFSFINDTNTGMYNSGANDVLRFATDGFEALRLTANQRIHGVDGTAASPTFAFMNEPDTGIYNGGNANSIRFSTGGTEALRITTDNQVQGVNGTVSNPTFSFINDPDTGIYSGGTNTNNLRLATGGTDGLRINSTQQLLTQDGTTTAPTFSFINDTNTGIYREAENDIRIVSGGTWGLAVIGGAPHANPATTTNTNTWRVAGPGGTELRVATSKREAKDQIEDIEGVDALQAVSLLRPRTFVFKPFSDDDPDVAALRPLDRHFGFIAEEVAEASQVLGINLHEAEAPNLPKIPNDATEEEKAQIKAQQEEIIRNLDGYVPSYWKEPHMIALCVAAIKALKAEIEELKAGR